MNPLIINPRGNSGSGKTYLTRLFMAECKPVKILGTFHEDDQFFRYQGKTWAVLGRYGNVCGGCDTIKTQVEIVRRVTMYADQNMNVWLEGLIMSTIYGTVGEFSERFGNRWVFAYLDTPLSVCLKRIYARRKAAKNDKPFNENNTRNRDATILRNREIALIHERRVIDLPYRDPLSPLLKLIRKEG